MSDSSAAGDGSTPASGSASTVQSRSSPSASGSADSPNARENSASSAASAANTAASTSTTATDDSEPQAGTTQDHDRRLERAVPTLATPIRRAGFWMAVVLPFLSLPLLASGLSTGFQTLAFVGLVALNLVALYVGHSYGR
ncbi:hypothetical protein CHINAEXTREME_14070 [Halobiforma lacisalsi AJ5]|uniref:Uncharacterized protein n=1 Tax=Natronobacterium lacisalsi AJ5 TaxID=358396 RepID=M0LFK6_NATLA|nr:hypothetical protein [Halobiforma lacisalsi]APW98841.1 hypothetical protein CHINAEXTREME_14070 [Halobiforma lacisalsi AJ5]EMA32336.1 hypothetical protein C445_11412 [Halobiforma lacisalsi AJ5]